MAIPSIDVSGFGDFTRGMQSGGNLFQQMMQPVMQQRGMQQADIHHKNNLGFKMQQLEQQALQHKQNLGISLQQLQMAQDLQPWQVKNLQAKVQYHQAQADALANEQNMLSQILSGQFGGMPANPQVQMQGGASGQSSVSAPPMSQVQEGFTKPQMHPAAAAIMKKKFNYDPNALTEPEKSQQRMSEFRAKEQYKQDQKSNQDMAQLTPTVRSQVQEEVFAIQKIKPQLQQLINMSPQTYTALGTANDTAYNALLFNLADGLVKAKKLPQTNDSIHKMEDSLRIGKSETQKSYKKRMEKEFEDLEEREKKGLSLLEGKKVSRSSEENNDPWGIR